MQDESGGTKVMWFWNVKVQKSVSKEVFCKRDEECSHEYKEMQSKRVK